MKDGMGAGFGLSEVVGRGKRPNERARSVDRVLFVAQRSKRPTRRGGPIGWVVFVGTNPRVPA